MSKVKEAYKEIEDVVGSEYITDKDFMKAAYSRNVDPAFPDRWADIIIRPESTEEVSEIVKIANKYKVRIVPRGGGADLVGGSVTEKGILLDLTRMNRIIEINETDYYCEVECGITWGNLLSELWKKDLTTGIIGPGSGYSATIGGGLSNSTAGGGSLKYGLVPDICLGVEVVLPNPQGTIIRTGAAANRYAQPFCRYGVAPDFTGLFMGDVGTMGIKTRAFLKLFPELPIKTSKNYLLHDNDYVKVYKLVHQLQKKVRDGLYNLNIMPLQTLKFAKNLVVKRPPKRVKVRGPMITVALEADDRRIIDVYQEKVNEIMKDDSRPFEMQELDLSLPHSSEYKFQLVQMFNAFHRVISLIPGQIACTTCHKIPVSHLPKVVELADQFDSKNMADYPPGSLTFLAVVISVLSNGHCILVGGFHGFNKDDQRDVAMKMWHKKIRFQVQYGAVHYWLGEAISQSIVEAGAFTPEFAQFFKNMKRTVDPNYILSPNKWHMHSYEDEMSSHIVKDE